MSAHAKLALAGAVAVLAVGVTVLVNERSSPNPPHRSGPVATSPPNVAAESADAPARGAPAPEGAAREATPLESPKSVAETPFGALHVKVVWGRDGTPAADVGVTGIAWSRPQCRHFTLDATTDANGECRLDGVEAGRVFLATDRGGDGDGRSQFDVARGATTEITLTIPPGADLLGIVDDDHGHGVADAEVWLSDNGCNPRHGRVLARSDANGAFRVRDLSGIRLISARAHGWTPSIPFWFEGKAGQSPKVHLALRGPGGAVRGRVVDADGNAVKRALVELGDEEKHLQSPVDAKLNSSAVLLLTTTSDDDGRFRFDGAMLGAQPLAARDPTHSPWTGTVAVAADATAEVEIRLARGFALDGRLVDAGGAGVAGVEVAVNGAWGFSSSTGSSGADGRFRIDHLPAGEAHVVAVDEKRGRAKATLRGAEGETVSWTGTLEVGLPIRGVVLDGDDAPVAGCVVQMSGPQTLGEDFTMQNTTAGADGRFVFENLVAGRYDVQISLPGSNQTPTVSERDVQPSRDERTFRVSRAQRCSAWFEGTVVDEAGRPIGDAHVTPYAVGGSGGIARAIVTSDAHTGRFRCGPYAPGDYRIQVKAEGLPLVNFPIGAVAADETREVGLLRIARGGTFRMRVSAPPGVALDALDVSCYGTRDGMNLRTTISNGVVTCEPAAEGECVVRLTAKGCMNQVVHVTIVAGQVTELEAALAAGLPLALRIQLPADVRKLRDDPEGRAYARLLDANGDDFDGTGLMTPEGDRDGGAFLDWSVRLVPGRYRLEFVEGATILRALPFEIDAATRPDAQFALDAR
jgi:protocatechuate 3,4-dioxygenase beta subunit